MRRALFLATAAALIGMLAILLAERRPSPPVPPGSPATVPSSAPDPARASSLPTARPAVHRFLTAYLAYEMGDRHAAAALRIRSTASLAREILDSRQRPARAHDGHTPIVGLTLTRLPDHPDLLIAAGTARRASGPEPFAFLFARLAGRWLAIAPAE